MLARPELDQVGKDLLTAAEKMEVNGWVRGHRLDGDGRMCVLGAIDIATGGLRSPHEYHRRLANVIDLKSDQFGRDIYNCGYVTSNSPAALIAAYWNNMLCKDQAEAVAKLREAAYLVEA